MVSLADAAKLALTVTLGISCILKPILDFLDGISPRRPILDVAVAVVLVTLPAAYLMGVILVYLHVIPPAAVPRGASRQLATLACTAASALLVALAVPLVAFLFLAGSPPGGDQ